MNTVRLVHRRTMSSGTAGEVTNVPCVCNRVQKLSARIATKICSIHKMSRELTNVSQEHSSLILQVVAVPLRTHVKHNSKNDFRSRHLGARAVRAHAHLRSHDRRSPGGEAPLQAERARMLPDDADHAYDASPTLNRPLGSPRDRRLPPQAAPDAMRFSHVERKRPAHMGAPRSAHKGRGYTSVAARNDGQHKHGSSRGRARGKTSAAGRWRTVGRWCASWPNCSGCTRASGAT